MAHSAHIFIDNANVFGGAQRAARALTPPEPWPAVRVYYKNLFRLIGTGYRAEVRVMAGSVPPGTEDLWKYASEAGYDTKLLRKVAKDDGRLGEQAVDEVLQLKILEVVLDHDPGTLVLVTGDGAPSQTGSSFLDQLRRALGRGWAVDVWSWGAQLSSHFSHLQNQSGNFLQVRLLDQYFDSITFCKGGVYTVEGREVVVADRVVARLPSFVG